MAALSPRDALLVPKLRRAGVKMPVRMIIAARKAGLPLNLAAAFLLQETGGGANVFGHDPTIFVGAGEVTPAKYRAYKAKRGAHGEGGMQGVGPMQLTYYSFQDEADLAGGAYNPTANMLVGFRHAAELIRRNGLHAGIAAYNGSGPAAERYAKSVLDHATAVAAVLAPKVSAPVFRPQAYLEGDVDMNRDLMVALAKVARDLRVKVHVNFGRRTHEEQTRLWNEYQTCLRRGRGGCTVAARPGTSKHETGDAADCVINGVNIGSFPGARAALKKYGLGLPVAGEPWHVEIGSAFLA